MKINADFSTTAIVHSKEQEWISSPMPGVERKPLDRVGTEVARATSIVQYAPKSSFSPHVHTGGEEFVVLDGIFQDEHGDFPIGSYVRNPPQSKHKPRSESGCVIFVKLWQFQPQERQHVNVIMENCEIVTAASSANITERHLYSDDHEQVKHITLAANTQWDCKLEEGVEILVLNGSVTYQQETLHEQSWLRVPVGQSTSIRSSNRGAKIWLKTGNLPDIHNQIKRVEQAL